jgi:hypothetical protein
MLTALVMAIPAALLALLGRRMRKPRSGYAVAVAMFLSGSFFAFSISRTGGDAEALAAALVVAPLALAGGAFGLWIAPRRGGAS